MQGKVSGCLNCTFFANLCWRAVQEKLFNHSQFSLEPKLGANTLCCMYLRNNYITCVCIICRTWERCDLIEIKERFVLISAGFLVFSEFADDQFGERFHGASLCLVKWIVLIQRIQGRNSLKCKPAAWLSKLCSIVITVDKVFKDEYRQSKVEVCVLLWLAQRQRIQHLISHFGNWTVKVYHYKIFSKKLKVKKTCLKKRIYKIVLIPLWVGLEMFVGPATRKISRCQPQHPKGTDTVPVRQSTLQKSRKNIFSNKTQRLFTFWSSQVQFARHISRAEAPTIQSGLGPSMLTTETRWFLNTGSWNEKYDKTRCFVFNIKVPSFVSCGKSGMIRWQLLESDILNEKIFLTEIRVSQRGRGIFAEFKHGA